MKIVRCKAVYSVIVLLCLMCVQAQAQKVALKTDALYWLTTTPNASVEFALSDKVTLEALAAYNPWTFKDDKKMKFWLVQPELRYWFCEKFEGHFIGVHLHGAQYFGGFKERRYDGYLAGAGITYGYHWILSPHWNLELAVGAGYARMWYDETPRIPCKKCAQSRHKDYLGPTKAALSICYLFSL